jgi:hypothetical protein
MISCANSVNSKQSDNLRGKEIDFKSPFFLLLGPQKIFDVKKQTIIKRYEYDLQISIVLGTRTAYLRHIST